MDMRPTKITKLKKKIIVLTKDVNLKKFEVISNHIGNCQCINSHRMSGTSVS